MSIWGACEQTASAVVLPVAHASERCGRRNRVAFAPRGADVLVFAAATLSATTAGWAANGSLLGAGLQSQQNIVGVAAFVGIVLLATVITLLHLTGRKRSLGRERTLLSEIDELHARLDRSQVFLSAEPQIVIAWRSGQAEPDVEGDLALVTDAPIARRVLVFSNWLPPTAAMAMEGKLERLRSRGEGFRMPLVTTSNRYMEAEGRAVGGRALLRLRDVSGDRAELQRLREIHGKALGENDALRTMLDAIPNPVWLRDAEGRLAWVNLAYGRAVEAEDRADALVRGLELLEKPARDAAAAMREENRIWRSRVGALVAGERHNLAVIDVPAQVGSVGIGTDLAELEAARADLERQIESHRVTLDKLPTGVAIFDRVKHLVFYNAAYRQIWSLDQAFLDQKPSDGEILDRLRAQRRLPEQADFRAWKASIMASYQAVEATEEIWHLPDRRTIRMVANPNPQGGITYLFDDVTERFNLESDYVSLHRVQSETLDNLKEGVAVFGSDGRLKLHNPAFVELWQLGSEIMAASEPHVDEIARNCSAMHPDPAAWDEVRTAITGLHDERTRMTNRFVRRDGSILEYATTPLPDGATLVTFADITDGANFERALTDRNEALMEVEKLRNEFVQKVSYELRTPLTNIIGFAEFLTDPSVGPLNPRQAEYAGFIEKSSTALLAIINNILDLTTIDAGAMELSLTDVDIARTIAAAAEGLNDRLAAKKLRLNTVMLDDIGSFVADDKRILQILFNLLSNAIAASSVGQTITLAVLRRDTEIVFKVTDQGRGIPAEMLDKIFDPVASPAANAQSGVGLGLSIVRSFVELHDGRVLVDSAPGEGTTFTCILPVRTAQTRGLAIGSAGGLAGVMARGSDRGFEKDGRTL